MVPVLRRSYMCVEGWLWELRHERLAGIRVAARELRRGDPQGRSAYAGVRGRARWVQSGMGFRRPRRRVLLRPLCWLAGGHVEGMATGDDEGCLICDAESRWDETTDDWKPARWWEVTDA
jgi:hypothetical protein